MNYTENKIEVNPTSVKYQIKKPDGDILTFAEFLNLLRTKNREFLKEFRGLGFGGESFLAEDGIRQYWDSAYFWECIPVSKATINKPFEFVKTKSEALNTMTQNWSSFQEHIDQSSNPEVTSFSN